MEEFVPKPWTPLPPLPSVAESSRAENNFPNLNREVSDVPPSSPKAGTSGMSQARGNLRLSRMPFQAGVVLCVSAW